MLFLKICGGTWENASRDKRELSVYQEMGYETAVLAKGGEKDKGRIDNYDGFKVYRYTTRPFGRKCPNSINRFASLFLWASFVKKMQPDVITGHDLMPGLTIAWLATQLIKKKPLLIYDSHEFEMGRYANRSKLASKCIARWEGYLMRKCAFSIMVNKTIAEEVKRVHCLTEDPIVIRSTPNYWEINREVSQQFRQKMIDSFESKRIRKLLMFHGNIGKGNGIEDIIPNLKAKEDLGLVLLGKRTDQMAYEQIVASIEKNNVKQQVLFLPAVKIEELWKYVSAVDLEIMPIVPIVRSYYYSLPNKLFEAIQAEVPVVTSDLPEMERIVRKYQIGLISKAGDVQDLGECINKLLSNSQFYTECRQNILKAKAELCWEEEKKVLIDAVREKIKQ